MFLAIPLLLPIIAVIVILASPLWCVTIGSLLERQMNRKRLLFFSLWSFVLTAAVSGGLWFCGTLKTQDKEVWNFKIVRVQHEERWSEKEQRTRQVSCGRDSKGHTKYRTETYHVTEYYGPYWKAIDEYGSAYGVDESVYQRWKKTWANEKKTGEHKGSAAGFTTPITGGIFQCDWTQDFNRIFPWSNIHYYENKVRYSHSVLKYKEPTRELEKKYPRPADMDNIMPVLSYGKSFSGDDIDLLRRTSAQLGPRYLVHPILVAFGPDTSRAVVDDVLSAWRGPNKNELVTFAAFRGNEVLWCEVHSWMDDTTIHATLRDEIMADKFSAKRYSDLLLKYVPKQWRKKSFKDFDYLRVEIHWGWGVGAILVSIAGILGLFLLVDRNCGRTRY
jgi:hypothetical protein